MKLIERLWKAATYVISTFSLSPDLPTVNEQSVLPYSAKFGLKNAAIAGGYGHDNDHLVFPPPSGSDHDDFTCDYRAMGPDWIPCSSELDRECWLRNTKTGEEYNINTDYEFKAPKGIKRYYEMNLTDTFLNADGLLLASGKLFNSTYPGPWIQACWGDTLHVNVTNRLKWNGTSVHWHGIRQNLTMQSDGVNGVTQCAVAPNDYFEYVFDAVQYGSSWYHSHYSVQYADGAAGPMTIHGPSSAPYDEARKPIIMTDWYEAHNSAFEAIHDFNTVGLSILLNGKGNITQFTGDYAYWPVPKPHTINFQNKTETGLGRAKKYLLRLINTSFDSTFIFSIDNHRLQVVGSDFVPIEPYNTTSVLVGIGQRYHVIVEADPIKYSYEDMPKDGNFWMRTWVAKSCGTPGIDGYEKTGILRYNSSSQANPSSNAWCAIPKACSDEPYKDLVPKLKWDVGFPASGSISGSRIFNLSSNFNGDWAKKYYPLAHFDLGDEPLRVDYGDAIFMHLNDSSKNWPKPWVVIQEDNVTSTSWIWMIIQGKENSAYSAHPIHLHGHDFAILEQIQGRRFNGDISGFTLKNPPRRDVALLPNNGYLAIAFKADNPGSWLVHCHIAYHASWGLGMQILERQADANKLWPKGSKTQIEAERVCKNWKAWESQCLNWAVPCSTDKFAFHDDSGV